MLRCSRSRSAAWSTSLALLAGCVAYEAAPISVAAIDAALPAELPAPLSVEGAWGFALEHNPKLLSLRAQAEAAGLEVPSTHVDARISTHRETVEVLFDPAAELSVLQQGAAVDQAVARQLRALAALRTEEWRVLVAVAECFALEAVLRRQDVPPIDVEPEPFRAAGLGSELAVARLAATHQAATAERAVIESLRTENCATMRSLLGAAPAASIAWDLPGSPDFPAPPDHGGVLRRPDLAEAVAAYESADADFRKAVADQYPSLRLGPELPFTGGGVDLTAIIDLPLGASGPARAAGLRRDAARSDLATAVLQAQRQEASAAAAFDAAAAAAVAASGHGRASRADLAAARRTLDVEVDAFPQYVQAAARAIRDVREQRQAEVELVRARVQLAASRGWPAAEATP